MYRQNLFSVYGFSHVYGLSFAYFLNLNNVLSEDLITLWISQLIKSESAAVPFIEIRLHFI